MDPQRFAQRISSSLLPKSAEPFAPPMLVGDHVQAELKHISLA